MSTQLLTNRLPWHDRWSQPTVDQLLDPLDKSQRRGFEQLFDLLDGMERVDREIVWYGDAWKWTIHYTLAGQGRNRHRKQTVCYLVPRQEQSIVCVPMSQPMIDDLPMKRLSKYIRDGVKSAKCAIEIHWAHWTPTNQSEVKMLIDLLRRKHNFETLGTTSLAVTPQARAAEQ
jgi:hypothetical protein